MVCARYSIHGIKAQMFYVRNSQVNNYALGFSVRIPADINSLNFTWESSDTPQVSYKIALFTHNASILKTPQLSIPLEGKIPKTKSEFEVFLKCVRSGNVNFLMQVNLTYTDTNNVTSLNFKREKNCRIGNSSSVGGLGTDDNDDPSHDDSNLTTTKVFYISVGVVSSFILLFVFLVAFIALRSIVRNQHYPPMNSYTTCTSSSAGVLNNSVNSVYSKPLTNGGIPNGSVCAGSVHSYMPVPQEPMENIKNRLRPIAVDKTQITIGTMLLEGTFGRVYQGIYQTWNEEEEKIEKEVFIKTVTDQASDEQRNLLIKESCMLKGLSHKNILPILCVALQDEAAPMIMFSFMGLGNLKQFLRNGRIGPGDTHQAISTRDLVYLAIQITHALMYLSKKKVIHKDLATRNCVIDEHYNLKVTDNALARDLFPGDYHCLGDNENRPVKWMAIESIIHRSFTPASDVWAFGVTLWELMTLGQTPYIDVDPFEMTAYLKAGYRMAQPPNCPDELFSLMAYCWALLPQDRPMFTQLCSILRFSFPVLATENLQTLDIVFFSHTPLIIGGQRTEIRGYTIKADRSEDISLGVLNEDRDLRNVTWADSGTTLSTDTVFPQGSTCYSRKRGDFDYLAVQIPPGYPAVFSYKAKKNGIMSRAAIVIMSSTGKENIPPFNKPQN
ncbi:tyrosine-protein kinase RYK-like [Anneissia japonica]|uniref:tyrosine-protein kinase RYK-like n=1 Tax=Anneissia japonica TaxID=1529436 RepID=UPI001425AE81|nr:tyrosine-protein kinase RYK-like [Anneissia japonica]